VYFNTFFNKKKMYVYYFAKVYRVMCFITEGVLTGDRSFPDLFSTTSQMTIMFSTDTTGNDRGFLANFSTGLNLGQPGLFSSLYCMRMVQ